MNITYLQEFIEVGLSLNLSETAKKLHVSQPSISKHIAALERECGTALLQRGASHVQLTNAGQVLFEESFKLVRLHDEALARIRSLRDIVPITVGGLYENAMSIGAIGAALAAMNAGGERLSLNYQDSLRQSPYEQLREEKADVVITILASPEEVQPEFEAVFLFADPMVCLVQDGHAFAERESISVRELASQTILQPVGSHTARHGRSTVSAIFERYGISPVQQPVFVKSISELSLAKNPGYMLIMEESMVATQLSTKDYHVARVEEPDVAFDFYAVTRAVPAAATDAEANGKQALIAEFVNALARACQ